MSYSDKVLDHYSNPRNVGSMDKSSADVGTGLVGAPECGDVMKLQIKVNRDTNVIEDAKFKTFGCGSAIASSSLATEWVKGKTVHREGTLASSGKDPLFSAGRGRDPRRDRRLEEKAGSRQPGRCRNEVVGGTTVSAEAVSKLARSSKLTVRV